MPLLDGAKLQRDSDVVIVDAGDLAYSAVGKFGYIQDQKRQANVGEIDYGLFSKLPTSA